MKKIFAFVLLAASLGRAHADTPVSYVRDIQPILAENCFHCHGFDPKTRDGGRRLDIREGALEEIDGVRGIVPGKPDESELWLRVNSKDRDDVMPPPKSHKTLKPTELALLRRWIEQGAEYQRHWAFEAPTRRTQGIDATVRARLEKENLAPSPKADKATLLRRLALDLIGLPPSPAELDAFEKDAAPDAYARQVERLLASPAFGEKWARHWMDVARYADSHGFEKDLPRQQWIWRDWVIDAINRDMPYDQFLVEQIAGDLIERKRPQGAAGASPADAKPRDPDHWILNTSSPTLATGFLRNGMVNEEGAIIAEEFRNEAMFDRLDAVGKAALGLTLQCAQCHAHKFDPISQEEYFGIFAFFNDAYEAQSWVYVMPQREKIAQIAKSIDDAESRLKSAHPGWQARFDAWQEEQRARLAGETWQIIEPKELHSVSGLNHPTRLADHSILTLGHRTTGGGADIFAVAEPVLAGATGLRFEALRHDDLPHGGPGFSYKGTWAITEMTVTAQRPGGKDWEPIKLVNATADFAEPEHKLEAEWDADFDTEKKRVCGPAPMMIDGNIETAWRADRGAGRRNAESVAVVQFEKPLDLPAGTRLKVAFRYRHSGDDNGDRNTMVGRMRLALTTAPDPKTPPIAYAAQLALLTPAEKRTPEQQREIFAAWRASVAEFKSFNDEIEAQWKQFPEALTSVMHAAQRRPEDARATSLLDRGVWNKPKQRIEPHTPAALHPLIVPEGRKPTRLDFARWLADKRSPLAARVAVNRVWQAIFGSGLVETSDDFGTRAPLPEYLDLLDWLACEFMEPKEGRHPAALRGEAAPERRQDADAPWSLKHLVRTIVTSDTYQQSSRITPQLLERDPQNRLLARGPRFRAEAEVIRDLALSASGLLSRDKIGGASFFPPVPESLFASSFRKVDFWHVAPAPGRYRRSLYVFRRRSMPDPALSSFDAPNADFACARRVRSNTALAPLTAMNEPVFVEAARALALRTLHEAPAATDEARAAYAFRLCTGRTPRTEELADLLDLLRSRKARLAEGWMSARELVTGDGSLPKLPPGATPNDAAAWTIVARVLLNLDETLTKS